MRAEMERRIALGRERASAAGGAADSIRVALAGASWSILTLACQRGRAFVDSACFARCSAGDAARFARAPRRLRPRRARHVGACERARRASATRSNRRVGGHGDGVRHEAMFDVSEAEAM